MMILIFYILLLAILLVIMYSAIQAYLMLSDWFTSRRDWLELAGGVGLGCLTMALWLLFVHLIHNNPFA